MKEILLIIVLIGINAFFAAAEISIISLNKFSLERKAEEGDKKSKQLLAILQEPSKFLATIQVGVTLAGFFTSASAAVVLSDMIGGLLRNINVAIIQNNSNKIALVVTTILISYVTLLFGELIPKRVALGKTEYIASRAVGVIKVVDVVAKPIVVSLTYAANFFVNMFQGKDEDSDAAITEEEIRMLINIGEEKGIFRKTEKDMINSIFQFDDIIASDVMTPRPDIVGLNINSSLNEVLNIISENKRSRIPVYDDGIDNIIGILYTKDLIVHLGENNSDEEFDLKEFLRNPVFVTEYIKIDNLFKEMQKSGVHISIVIDEFGSTAGLVTMEDLLEEIVGNIYDEYEEIEEEICIKNDNEIEVDGGITVVEVNEVLNSDYPDIYDTISGLILDSLGRLPMQGESLVIGDYIFVVTEIDDKRIKKVLIKKDIDSE